MKSLKEKTLEDWLMESKYLRGLVSTNAVDAYIESLHMIIRRFEEVDKVNTVKEFNRPTPPNIRMLTDFDVVKCPICGSGYPRKYILFGKRVCRQPKCENHHI
jgi:hypothetical protein